MNPFADIRFVTVAVNYADILDVTLAYNANRMQSILVVTHGCDKETQAVCRKHDVDCIATNAMFADGAYFNKYAALEIGLETIGRHGWLGLIDADILLPKVHHNWEKRVGNLYVPRRYVCPRIPIAPDLPPDERKWRRFKPAPKDSLVGYCSIFHSLDPVLGKAPWHNVTSQWVAGPDREFQCLWAPQNVVRPPIEVLHLGLTGRDWCGRTQPWADGEELAQAEKNEELMAVMRRNRYGKRNSPDLRTDRVAASNGFFERE